jgi:hypothetical protein
MLRHRRRAYQNRPIISKFHRTKNRNGAIHKKDFANALVCIHIAHNNTSFTSHSTPSTQTSYIPRIDHYLLHTRCHRASIRTHHANYTSAVTCSPKPHSLPLLPPRTNKASQQTSNQWLVVVSEKAWNDSRKSSNEGLTARSLLLKCELTIHHGSRFHLRTPWPSTGICRIHTIDEGRELGRFYVSGYAVLWDDIP